MKARLLVAYLSLAAWQVFSAGAVDAQYLTDAPTLAGEAFPMIPLIQYCSADFPTSSPTCKQDQNSAYLLMLECLIAASDSCKSTGRVLWQLTSLANLEIPRCSAAKGAPDGDGSTLFATTAQRVYIIWECRASTN